MTQKEAGEEGEKGTQISGWVTEEKVPQSCSLMTKPFGRAYWSWYVILSLRDGGTVTHNDSEERRTESERE